MKGITLFKGRHVYVVLEFPHEAQVLDEPVVHDVFSKREYAENQAKMLKKRHKKAGHIAVLKKRVRGAEHQL